MQDLKISLENIEYTKHQLQTALNDANRRLEEEDRVGFAERAGRWRRTAQMGGRERARGRWGGREGGGGGGGGGGYNVQGKLSCASHSCSNSLQLCLTI